MFVPYQPSRSKGWFARFGPRCASEVACLRDDVLLCALREGRGSVLARPLWERSALPLCRDARAEHGGPVKIRCARPDTNRECLSNKRTVYIDVG